MIWTIDFDKQFASDLENALHHYETAGSNVADRFYSEFEQLLDRLTKNPRQFPYFRQEIRRANFRKFPYHILFEIQIDSVWVFVLSHDRRNPDFGLNRY